MDAEAHHALPAEAKFFEGKRVQRRRAGPGVDFGLDGRNTKLRQGKPFPPADAAERLIRRHRTTLVLFRLCHKRL